MPPSPERVQAQDNPRLPLGVILAGLSDQDSASKGRKRTPDRVIVPVPSPPPRNRRLCRCGCSIKFTLDTPAQGAWDRCHFCNKRYLSSGPRLRTRDHIVPWSKDGSHHLVNLVWSCLECNSDKSDSLPEPHNGCEICGMAILAHERWLATGVVPSLEDVRRLWRRGLLPSGTSVAPPRPSTFLGERIRALPLVPSPRPRNYDRVLGVPCNCNIGVQECPIHPGRLRTKEERIFFGKDFDRRYAEGVRLREIREAARDF